MMTTLKKAGQELLPPVVSRSLRSVYHTVGSWVSGDMRKQKEAERYNPANYERYLALNKNSGTDSIVLRPDLTLRISPESKLAFEYFCYRSDEMVEELDAFLDVAASRLRLLDVGALHGIFSLVFTRNRPSTRALAIDPSPLVFPTLLYNLYLNPACNIKPIQIALGNRETVIPMMFDWQHLRAVGDNSNGPALTPYKSARSWATWFVSRSSLTRI